MNVKLDERSKKVAAIIGAAGAKYSSIAHAQDHATVATQTFICYVTFNEIVLDWKRSFIGLACVNSETHNLQRVFRPGGVVPYIDYIGMCGTKGCRFGFSRFGFSRFGLGGMVCAL